MTARHSTTRQTGVTLVELILSMVIISIALVGILSVMNLTVAHSADPVVQHQAIAIAESYLEEITLKAYGGSWAGEDRAEFDDVDDYKHLPDNTVRDQHGNSVAGLSQYSVAVSVSDEMTLAGGVKAKQITVNVTGPGVPRLSLAGYKARY